MLFLLILVTSRQSTNIEYADGAGKQIKLGEITVEAMSIKTVRLK